MSEFGPQPQPDEPSRSGLPEAPDNEPEREREKKTYTVEGKTTELISEVFEPTNAEAHKKPGSSVIFLSGISMPTDASPELCQTFANDTGSKTYSIDTPGGHVKTDADAIGQYIVEKQLTNIVIAGNSLGGVESLYLIKSLREHNPDIAIDGLILIDSAGLYDQSTPAYPYQHGKDLFETRKEIQDLPTMKDRDKIPTRHTKYEQAAFRGGPNEILTKKLGVPIPDPIKALHNLQNLVEATREHPDLGEIDVPVILVQGEQDRSFKPEKIIPSQNPDSKKPFIEREENIDDDGDYIGDQREQYLKEHLFKDSPYVRMIVPGKAAHHNLMYLRPDSVAHASLYLLERFKRKQKE